MTDTELAETAAPDEPEETAMADHSDPDDTEPPPRRDPVVGVAVAITLVAAVLAAWFGWSYHSTSGDGSLTYAHQRDQVLRTAEQEIVNLNTLDYRQVDAGLRVWQDSTTADLYNQIVTGRDQLRTDVQQARTTSNAQILESGFTELDTHAGKAEVLAAVRITVTTGSGQPSARVSRLIAQLTNTASGWKLSALGQAPTENAGS